MTDEAIDPGTNPVVGEPVGTESSLSNWAGDYVTDMLGRGWGLSEMPYDAYEGPLVAGASPLQEQAWTGLSSLAAPGADAYTATDYGTGRFTDPGVAQSYMNPFLEQVMRPQMDELRRQSEIQRNMDAARLTKAGAFGGSRQAIMDSERIDNTARLMNEVLGTGYRDAYNRAADIFRTDEARQLDASRLGEESRQFEANFGNTAFDNALRLLGAQQNAGAVERGIAQEGIQADLAQFMEERDFPFKQLQFMQSLLQGLPLEAQSVSYAGPSGLSNLLGGTSVIMSLLDLILGGEVDEGGGLGDQDWQDYIESDAFQDFLDSIGV